MRNGNSRACSGVFPSPPAQKLHERTWGLPHYLVPELHHVRPVGLLLHLPQRKRGQREREASVRAARIKGAWIAGCYSIRPRRTHRPSYHCFIIWGRGQVQGHMLRRWGHQLGQVTQHYLPLHDPHP